MDNPRPGEVELLFQHNSPSACVLSATGNSVLERTFATAAATFRVPTTQFIDSWVNYQPRFVCDGVELFPDLILAPDERARQGMRAEGIPETLIQVIGQPYLERLLTANSGKRIANRVLLATQPVSRHYGLSLGYDEKSFLIGAVAAILAAGFRAREIDIRIHPAESETEYRDCLDSPAFDGAAEISIMRSDSDFAHRIVIGMFSSVMAQALLHGACVISFQPEAKGEDRCFLSAAGYIGRATSGAQLREMLFSPTHASDARDLVEAVRGSIFRFEQLILGMKAQVRFT